MPNLMPSWIESANSPNCPFPLNNLPYGVFSVKNDTLRCGVAIGDRVLDVTSLEKADILRAHPDKNVLADPTWNAFIALEADYWQLYRDNLQKLLAKDVREELRDIIKQHLVPLNEVTLHMPFQVSEFTDFYASRHHATNVGTMFRGAENALPPNWLHIPIGYNGRASSVVVSGTDIRRPWGQLKGPNDASPRYAPSQRFDIELEIGAIVGKASNTPLSVDEADANIFGYVLLNDWSARDIQAWEYQPLGPFQAKATATSISPWIVTKAALEPFRCSTPDREVPLLPHIADTTPMLYDIELKVEMIPEGGVSNVICHTNYKEMYYSSAQQLAHHTTSGCPMRSGDLLGSGTISGPNKENRGSLLEISWGGKEPLTLSSGEQRSFIEDGDTLILSGVAKGQGYCIGFGECKGTVIAAKRN